jgi:soluble lytic murein transglycosylase-like protein
MINVNQITSQLAKMPDPALQQYAAMHKNDPYTVALALAESNRRKEMRTGAQMQQGPQPKVVDQEIASMAAPQQQMLPEDTGIAQLPAPNIQGMAGGGIVAFDEGGEVPRFQNRGQVEDPFKNVSRDLKELVLAAAAKYDIDPDIAMRLVQQESKFDPTAKSPKGAMGLTQLMPDASKEMGLDPAERTNPAKNVDAGFGYLRKQLNKYGNDYSKALSAYNWGGGNVDKHLEKNDGKISAVGLPKETANYLTKILPMGAASAAQDKSFNAIPQAVTKESKAAQAADPSAPRAITGNQAVIGAGETGLQYLTGLLALPTAGGAAALGQLPNVLSGKGINRAEMEQSFKDKAGQVTYQPRTEGGQAVSEGFARTLEDLKIPPYLAHMGNLSPRRGTSSMKADLAEIAAERTRQAETPRLAGPTTDATMIQGKGQAPVQQGRAVANQLSDMADAAAWREAAAKAGPGIESTRPEILARNAAIQRAQNVAGAVGASPAIQAASAAPGGGGTGMGLPSGWGSDLGVDAATEDLRNGLTKGDVTDVAKAAPAATKGGIGDLFKDPLLQMGLNLMSSQNPRFLGGVGEAGIATAGMQAAQRKDEAEQAYKAALAKNYGVDPLLQRLNALQDPKTAAAYAKMKEMDREPVTKAALFKEFLASPAGMAVSMKPDEIGPAFANYVKSYESVMGPLGGIPPTAKVTRVG